ncbi:MAG: phosphoribosylformylglycinamidine synthase subunit PurQ [Rickettsiaceae bacterium H1]|nr:phosphoribosylformylglycinamidine synthase subunit PurQ [Rickettsiaceae bacterium H1]
MNIIIISGFGLNCEEETKFAFSLADSTATIDIIHINDLIKQPNLLKKYRIMAIPGGFSYGDHTGAGNAFAWYLKNNLIDEIQKFRLADKLIIGICNGCQILVKLFPKEFPMDLLPNDSNKYRCLWIDVNLPKNNCIWCWGIEKMRLPIAHGEGKFKIKNDQSINVAMKYLDNPNGSDLNAAALASEDGKVLAIMPHPERAVMFTQHDNWTLLKEKYLRSGIEIPNYGEGLAIFQNAVNYFK